MKVSHGTIAWKEVIEVWNINAKVSYGTMEYKCESKLWNYGI